MRLLFVKGDKGLVANRDGLFYFPDRNSSIVSEGLYNCTVTIDKGNYAFVTGNLVDTKEPSVEYVSTMLCRELFETKMFSYERIDSFKVKKIGCSYIIFVTDAMYTQIKYMDQNNDVKPLMMYSDERRHYNMRKLYDASQFPDADDYDSLKSSALQHAAKALDAEMQKKVAGVALVKEMTSVRYKLKRFTIIDSLFIMIETEYYGSFNYESIYVYNEEYGVVKIRYTQEMLGNLKQLPSTAIDVTAVGDYLLENHLGRAMGEEPTYVKEVIFMGNTIKVICLNGALLLDDINKEDQKKAAASFAELEAYRKKVSKKLSRSALSELKELSPKQVLNLQFLL